MSLIDKFNSVEITADTRISEVDRKFCQTQKEAYDHARAALKFMAEHSQKYLDEQTAILERCENESYGTYLGDFKPSKFTEELRESHDRFISRIFYYFQHKYKVTIDSSDADDVLLPKKPEGGWRYNEEEWKAYNKTVAELSLDYQAVLDQIFIQLGGFSFQDKAVQELKQKAHDAAWNSYRGNKTYEQKKAVISFTGYACSFDSWHEEYHKGEHQIKLSDSMKNVIRALVHFEYNSTDHTPYSLTVLLGYSWETYGTEMSVGLEKIKSIKCFKNGRVDIRFTSEAFARQFVEDYLGTAI